MAHVSKKTRHKQLFCGFCARIGLMKKNKTKDTDEHCETYEQAVELKYLGDIILPFPGDDVVPQETTNELRQLLREKRDDETLVSVFCRVDNYLDTYEMIGGDSNAQPGDEFAIPRKEFRKWLYLYLDLRTRIERRIKTDNLQQFHNFIEKNGYPLSDGNYVSNSMTL